MYLLGLDAIEESISFPGETISPKEAYDIHVKEEQRSLQKITLVCQVTLAVVALGMLYLTLKNGGKK